MRVRFHSETYTKEKSKKLPHGGNNVGLTSHSDTVTLQNYNYYVVNRWWMEGVTDR